VCLGVGGGGGSSEELGLYLCSSLQICAFSVCAIVHKNILLEIFLLNFQMVYLVQCLKI
jgi:hypothetical protein